MTKPAPYTADQAHLLTAFCQSPFGPYTAEVEKFARWVYFQPGPRRWVLQTIHRHRLWQLARFPGVRGMPLEEFPQCQFHSIADGAAEIARRRWAVEVLGQPDVSGQTASVSSASHLLAYVTPWSVSPGERVDVRMSAAGADTVAVDAVRIVCGDDTPQGPGLDLRPIELPIPDHIPARVQPLHPGSAALVTALPALRRGLTVQCWANPWLPLGGPQTILASGPDEAGNSWTLGINARGRFRLTIETPQGSSELVLEREARPRQWYALSARIDCNLGVAELHVQSPEQNLAPQMVTAHVDVAMGWSSAPLVMAARRDSATAPLREHFNGRLERPRLADHWLSDATLAAAFAHVPPSEILAELTAAWDFSVHPAGMSVPDLTGRGQDALLVNLPTRLVRGVDWDGTTFDPRLAPHQYAAIHFHDDDLYDAGWQSDLGVVMPEDLRSGCYAFRLRCAGHSVYLPFFVRPKQEQVTAPLAFLASTATYIAYGNYRFQMEQGLAGSMLAYPIVLEPEQVQLQHQVELGFSQYDRHRDGSGAHHASRLRPLLNHGPCSDVWNFNADTHLLSWLEGRGQPYDAITDEDLEREGLKILKGYACVMTGTHPEYFSGPMRHALQQYLDQGGRLLYLGGNGFYWRIAWHPHLPGVTELRRAKGGARYWAEEPGESTLAFSGEPGGLWRGLGSAPERLVGVGTRAIGFDISAPYRLTDARHDARVDFIFTGLEGISSIGDRGYVGGGAAGSEIDAASFERGTPAHALIIAVADGLPSNTQPVPEDLLMCHPAQSGGLNPELCAQMVFFETRGGGAVFAASSVAYAGAMIWNGGDNSVSRLTGNVLRRFLDPLPFEYPDT